MEHQHLTAVDSPEGSVRASVAKWLWLVYLGVGMFAIELYFLIPGLAGYGIRLLLLTSALLAIIAGLLIHRPVRPLKWYLFALALIMAMLAAGTYIFYGLVLGVPAPTPSLADLFFVSSYVCAASGLVVIQSRMLVRNRASTIDPIIITVGIALLAWVFLMKPYVEDFSLTVMEKLVSISYPIMDVLLLAFVIRLLLLPGPRPTAYYLLVAGILSTLAFDVAYATMTLSDTYRAGSVIDALEMGFFVLFGASALHPSMKRLSDVTLESESRLGWGRLSMLAVASLMAPGVLLLEFVRGQSVDIVVVSVASAVLFLLVVARMSGIIWERDQAVHRESVLRRSAAELVGALDQREICHVAVNASQRLMTYSRRDSRPKVGIATGSLEHSTVEDVTPGSLDGLVGKELSLEDYDPDTKRRLLEGNSVTVGSLKTGGYSAPGSLAESEVERDEKGVVLVPLVIRGKFWGVIFAFVGSSISEEKNASLEYLAREIALALESRALEQEFHDRRGEERFRSLIQNSSDVVAIVGADGLISYLSPAVERVLGFGPELGTGRPIFSTAMMHPEDIEKARRTFAQLIRVPAATTMVDVRLRHANGGWVHVEAVIKNMLDDPSVRGVVINYRDVTERKDFEERLRYQAFHDPLTGLPNRSLFMDRLQRTLLRSKPESYGKHTAVLFLDLDNFKVLNDSLGHEAGDQILVAVAKRLESCLRPEDTPARFGGDEFCILLEDLHGSEDAIRTADQIGWALSTPFVLDNRQLFVNASIGIALNSGDSEGPSELLRNADVALYRAKADGKSVYRIFDESMSGSATERLNLEDDLRRAVRERQFVVFYQPQLEFLTGRLVGLEALVRWEHPAKGLLAPQDFLGVAEDTGLVSEMSRQVLQDSCRQVQEWKDRAVLDESVELSVNISPKQFRRPERLMSDIELALKRAGMPPDRLVLEITESMIMGDVDSNLLTLEQLKSLGVDIAIDDFGTGYSNLAYLKHFPVDMIKIDRSFVTDLDQNVEEQSIVEAVISLGNALDLRVMAEGVETTAQMEELMSLGCHQGQGYYFSKPLSAEQTASLLDNPAVRSRRGHRKP